MSVNQSLASRRRRAVLAGGLVLGLGAAVTLAAWNDSEYATGEFAAGAFDLEGSTDGITWDQHDSVLDAASLNFLLAPQNLAPADVVYAPFAVRLADGTTNDAVVTVSHETSTGNVANLTYGVLLTDDATCGAATTGETLVPAGTAITTVAGPGTFDLSFDADAAGAPQFLCFAVTAGAGLIQEQAGTVTWEFNAVSQA